MVDKIIIHSDKMLIFEAHKTRRFGTFNKIMDTRIRHIGKLLTKLEFQNPLTIIYNKVNSQDPTPKGIVQPH